MPGSLRLPASTRGFHHNLWTCQNTYRDINRPPYIPLLFHILKRFGHCSIWFQKSRTGFSNKNHTKTSHRKRNGQSPFRIRSGPTGQPIFNANPKSTILGKLATPKSGIHRKKKHEKQKHMEKAAYKIKMVCKQSAEISGNRRRACWKATTNIEVKTCQVHSCHCELMVQSEANKKRFPNCPTGSGSL